MRSLTLRSASQCKVWLPAVLTSKELSYRALFPRFIFSSSWVRHSDGWLFWQVPQNLAARTLFSCHGSRRRPRKCSPGLLTSRHFISYNWVHIIYTKWHWGLIFLLCGVKFSNIFFDTNIFAILKSYTKILKKKNVYQGSECLALQKRGGGR